MISLIIFLVILSILILVHEFGHFILAKKVGVKVEVFSLGFGPKLFGLKFKDTEYTVRLFPLGGYVKLAGDSWEEYKGNPWEYLSKPIIQRAKILVAGSGFNYILAFLSLWLVMVTGFPMFTTQVGELLKDMPAKVAGIQAQDKILAVDDTKIIYWEDLQKIIQNKGGQVVRLSVLRDDSVLEIKVPVEKREVTNIWGKKQNIGLIGIVPTGDFIKVRHGIFESFYLAFTKTIEMTYVTLKGILWLIMRKMSFKESVTGPVGIFFIAKGAIKMGLPAILHMISVLSLSLSVFNILPLPILDGGHLVLLLIEKIKGKIFVKKFDRVWSPVGLTLIILLALFVSFNDLIRFGVLEKITNFFSK